MDQTDKGKEAKEGYMTEEILRKLRATLIKEAVEVVGMPLERAERLADQAIETERAIEREAVEETNEVAYLDFNEEGLQWLRAELVKDGIEVLGLDQQTAEKLADAAVEVERRGQRMAMGKIAND